MAHDRIYIIKETQHFSEKYSEFGVKFKYERTKGVNPSLSWLNASISVSKTTFGFSDRHKRSVLTSREYPKQAAKCNNDIPLTLLLVVHENMVGERHRFDTSDWQ